MIATVAVVVRSGGESDRLDRALRSIRAQTSNDWVVVVAVGDGDDVTAAERLATDDDRVVVVRGEGRGGLANAALAVVDSELAVLHDDDGSWRPTFLAETVAFLNAHPDHVAVATRAELLHGDAASDGEVIAPREPVVSLTSLLMHNYVPPASLLFRRSAADAVGRYDEELPALEDWEFLLRLVGHGPVGFLADVPLAAWHAGPPPDEVTQRAAELLVRDRVLRRDLQGKEPGTGGLGILLALSDQLSGIAERWGGAHQDHLDVVTTEQRIEMGRMRGELSLMRELLTEVQEDIALLGTQVEAALSRPVGPLGGSRGNGAPPAGGGLARRGVRRLVRRLRSI